MSGGSTCLNSRENSGKRSLQIFLRSLLSFLRSLLSFLRSLQIFLRSLLLTEKRLQFWVRQVHWVHGIFVSPIGGSVVYNDVAEVVVTEVVEFSSVLPFFTSMSTMRQELSTKLVRGFIWSYSMV